MINTAHNVLLLDFLDGFLDQRVVADLGEPDELPGSLRPEVPLDDAEDELDGVVVGGVRDVVDEPELPLPHCCLGSFRCMSTEVVHEQADLLVAVGQPQTVYVFDELVHVDGELEDLEVLDSFFSGDAAQQGEGRLLEPGHVHGHVLAGQSPFCVAARLSCKTGLVDVDDTEAIVLRPGQLPLHVDEPLSMLLVILLLGRLHPSQLLLLDAVERVHLPQQRRVHLGGGKLLDEVLASIGEGERRLVLQGLPACEP